MQSITAPEFNPDLPDAVFDLDGTIFKYTVLERYVNWMCEQGVFEPLPLDIEAARMAWKRGGNTEEAYAKHTNMLVQFFIGQVAGKSTAMLEQAAEIVAARTSYRTWDATRNLIPELQGDHNIIAISHMPDWLVPPFTRGLGFVATLGSTYVTREGVFTGEAHRIDKVEAYSQLRGGDLSKLDIAMGDTMGDFGLFEHAQRPIAFNPSFTLATAVEPWITRVSAQKDLVTVTNTDHGGGRHSQEFHCAAAREILALVARRPA